MCVMEVRPGQRTSTMVQACTHNIGTVIGDVKMLAEIMAHREPDRVEHLLGCLAELETCYGHFLGMYGEVVADHVHTHDDTVVGKERELAEQIARVAEEDASRARGYYTR